MAKFVKKNCQWQRHVTATTVLALATLGSVTQISCAYIGDVKWDVTRDNANDGDK